MPGIVAIIHLLNERQREYPTYVPNTKWHHKLNKRVFCGGFSLSRFFFLRKFAVANLLSAWFCTRLHRCALHWCWTSRPILNFARVWNLYFVDEIVRHPRIARGLCMSKLHKYTTSINSTKRQRNPMECSQKENIIYISLKIHTNSSLELSNAHLYSNSNTVMTRLCVWAILAV